MDQRNIDMDTPGRTAADLMDKFRDLNTEAYRGDMIAEIAIALRIYRNAALTEAAGVARKKYFMALGQDEAAEEWLAKQIEALRGK